MEHRTRRKIYLASFFIFAIAATILVLIAQGYHFNFKERKIYRAGILVVSTNPEKAEIYLDGEETKQETPTTLKNIIPGEHTVTLKKEGYQEIEKRISINTETVNKELSDLEMFLKEPSLNQISSKNTEKFWVSGDQNKLIYFTKDDQKVWSLDLKKNKVAEINSAGINFNDPQLINWSNDNNQFLIKTSNYNYYRCDLNKKNLNLVGSFAEEIKKAEWHPQDSKRLFVLLEEKLYLFELEQKSGSKKLILDGTTGFTVNSNQLYCIIKSTNSAYEPNLNTEPPASQAGLQELWEVSLNGEKKGLVSVTLPPGELKKLIVKDNHRLLPKDKQFILLIKDDQNQDTLLTTIPGGKETDQLTVIDTKVKHCELSTDGQRLIYHKNNELCYYDFQNKEKKLVTRTQNRIENFFPHPSNRNYLYFKTPDQLRTINLEGLFNQSILTSSSHFQVLQIKEKNYFLILMSKDGQDYQDIYELNPQQL